MTLESLVTNLDLSLKLRDLGVLQRSLFWWVATYSHPAAAPTCSDCKKFGDQPHPMADGWYLSFRDNEDYGGYDFSAFLAGEICVALPEGEQISKISGWGVGGAKFTTMIGAERLVDAIALYLITNIENGNITVEEVNKRLEAV